MRWIAAGLLAVAGVCYGQAVVIGAGYSTPGAIDAAPGQVITIFARVPGKSPADPISASAPLPVTLGGFSVTLRQSFPPESLAVPILSVADAQSCSQVAPMVCDAVSQITVQIPYELAPNAPPGTVPRPTVPLNSARLEISYNASASATGSLILNPLPDRIHILNACDVAANPSPGQECLPVVKRADGTVVSQDNAPEAGEVLTLSVVGLGSLQTPVATGAAAPQQPAAVDGVLVGTDARANAAPGKPLADTSSPARSAQLQPGSVGIYQVTFTVPSLPDGTPGCSSRVQSNLTINIGRTSFDSVGICVVPAAQASRVPGRRAR